MALVFKKKDSLFGSLGGSASPMAQGGAAFNVAQVSPIHVTAPPRVVDARPYPARVPGTIPDVNNPSVTAPSAPNFNLNQPASIQSRRNLIDAAVKTNMPVDKIANITGLSKDEVNQYNSKVHPGYGAQNPLEAVGSFVGDTINAATGIVRKPITTVAAAANINNTGTNLTQKLQDLNQQYKQGKISGGRLQEQTNALTSDIIGNPVKVTSNGIERTNAAEQAKSSLLGGYQQGVDTASVLPAGRGVASLKAVGEGISKQFIKDVLKTNAKQALVYGSGTTANDIVQGRGVTPQSIALNYGTPLAFGSASEVTGRAAKPAVRVLSKQVQDVAAVAKANPEVGAVGKNVNKGAGGSKYNILTNDSHGNPTTQEIAAKQVHVADNVNTIIHREPKYGKDWHVSESTTGLKIADGRTQAEAIANASKAIQAHPDIQNIIAGQQKRFGVQTPQVPKAKVSLKPTTDTKILRALGMSDGKIKETLKNAQPEPVAVGSESTRPPVPIGKELLPLEKPNQSPQSAEQPGGTAGTAKLPSTIDYTPNPTTVHIPAVNPGDYEKVRSNGQLAGETVKFHMGQTIEAVNRLTPQEKANFWHAVEDPSLIKSKEMQTAVARWRDLANRVHATSQALGGNTGYLKNYARHNWDLTDPNQKALFDELMKRRAGQEVTAEGFKGLDNKPRVFNSIAEGQAAGFKLKNTNPSQDILAYGNQSASQLRRQAIVKGVSEADTGQSLTRTVDLKNGKYLSVSEAGKHALRNLEYQSQPRVPLRAYRAFNHKAKQILLSLSQFHTVNINILQAFPTLIGKGHPVKAVQGLVDTATTLFSKKRSDSILQQALQDGTIDDAARIGTPIKAGSDYTASGKLPIGKSGFGERAIFERQLPAMHVKLVKAVVADLKKRGISLDSPAARQAGNEVHQIMGYVNLEMRNLNPAIQKGLSDVLLAPQFTRSKWAVLRDAFTKGGTAGSYARAAVIGKYGIETAIILTAGAILGQKTDDWKDTLLRALFHPSIPTPMKDSKGNTIELGLPSNYLSEAAGLVGNLQRNSDGRLQPTVDPSAIPENLANYGRSRLALVPGDALKIGTNTNFANKPLYDPNAPLQTQIAQTAATLGSGHLPIGFQGVTQLPAFKKAMPKDIQQVLNAQDTGKDPIIKSIASSFGLTARTDKTVGKGLSTTRYYNQLDQAKKGLNRQESDAIDLFTGGKKNPVTGNYDVLPNANDSRAKATALLQNPTAVDHLITMNQNLSKAGEKVDPLWQQPRDNIVKYLQYQAMPPGSSDRTDWNNKNTWYNDLLTQRNNFFASLPPGDPNKPQLNIKYPDPSPSVQTAVDGYNALPQTQKGAYLAAHPEVVDQWAKQADYTNQMRNALGYSPLKNYPEATGNLQNYITKYSAADKATKKAIRNSNPQAYQSMIAYFDSVDLYNINKQGSLNQLQGEPDQTSKQNKAIQNLAKDIYQNPDGSYSVQPAGWMNGLSNGSGGGYGYRPSNPTGNPNKYHVSLTAGGKVKKAKKYSIKFTGATAPKSSGGGKPKVSIKKSKV